MKQKRRLIAALAGLVAAVPLWMVATASPSVSAGTATTFTPVADAFVNQSSAGTNYGTRTVLRTDSPGIRSYARFNVANLSAPVTRATLRLYAKDANAAGFEVRPVASTTWGETTITYSNAPAVGAVAATSGPVSAGAWFAVDVTSLVAGNGAISVALTTTSTVNTRYSSREAGAQAPQLVVETATTTTTTASTTSTSTTTTTAPSGSAPVLAVAGDIACDPSDGNFNGGAGAATACREKATSDLLVSINPTVVASLGDNQYENGALTAFNSSFDPSWGRVKSRIRPAVGNHEYKTDSKASGYYTYFGAAAGDPTKGWYSYDLGTWHVVVLNGNCGIVGGCGSGSAEETWLKNDLAAHPAACTVAYWHQPRWSSGGEHGSDVSYDAWWKDLYGAGVEIVLNGHDHDYERFGPQTPAGTADSTKGVREFVVGTGGRSHYVWGTIAPNSEVRNNDTFGVLKLTLQSGSYSWQFVPEAGKTFTDSGTGTCH